MPQGRHHRKLLTGRVRSLVAIADKAQRPFAGPLPPRPPGPCGEKLSSFRRWCPAIIQSLLNA